MIKSVFDTNIYISAFNFGGIPYRILEKATEGIFSLYISEEIITEVIAISAKKFGYSDEKLGETTHFLRDIAIIVHPKISLNIIKKFPSDNRILECANEAQADYLISGDKKHILPLKKIGRTETVSAEEFLKIIEL